METSCFAKNVIFVWALAFIASSPLACVKAAGCTKERQTRALLEIKNATNASSLAGWDGRNCCKGYRIECGGIAGGVSGIYLEGHDYDSSRSTWYPNVTLFTLFDELEILVLSNMQIGGSLEAFCELKRLKYLRSLDLTGNRLEGVIPSCLGMIGNLEVLYLSNNRLYGNLPPSIFSNQSKIEYFDVSANQLDGVLSFSTFANASSLKYLDLSSNCNLEIETESRSWVPTFQLTSLNLANCSLNKKNGHVFPSFITTQDSLEWLDLSHNLIEGNIPCQLLFNTSIISLSLRSNKIDGSLFLGCFANRTSSLQFFDMSSNNVKGSLPENIGHLLPLLYDVDMSSNALEGIIPWSFGNLSFEALDLSNNKLSGTIPQSLTTNGTRLVYLNLSNNTLEGEMLPRDANMTSLECLQLGGNQFQGMISPAISNSPFLLILDIRNNNLSGNIPKWLYDHPSLVQVLLSRNHFEGHLLRRMCQMESLQVFDISDNHISGGIPSCLDNITFWKKNFSNSFLEKGPLFSLAHPTGVEPEFEIKTDLRVKHEVHAYKGIPLSIMTIIDMSSNQLTGNIPFEMGELSQLRSLNLSNNFLTGSIPNSFQNLKNMESLDLSHNKLSGRIPFEFVEMTSLSVFSVAYNNLFGRVPFERQFSTFESQCYNGNPDLCGDPLPRNCSTTNQLEPGHEEEKEETRIIDSPLFFYAFVAVSYAFGFWVFFGILIIKKNWRHIYFRAIDRIIESCFEMFYR
ncbi:receptor-like protein 56 [Alnus glutinosa]|uniref:receptor-like protein 56 n=1 Tax=Alnus glutinosa TaxID=3517 RepID=UPI002D79241B|nr:receptor-like protein 56 [Alnus glutinosa]XP_062145962.1 receptor-like protein 56 [Alnus glutinosa]XP_062145963.1 receptor-like protein 56 [Alnus glutinosa]XP_062145964.1 receptor-like protein 56 [Alnus glutinosa]